jgi:transcription antitermination protein NusB
MIEFFKNVNSRHGSRSLALNMLYSADRCDYATSPEAIISKFENGLEIEIERESFAAQILTGVMDKKEELDGKINPFLENWKPNRIECCTKLIIRIALWEIIEKETPAAIAIDEAVELAKTYAEKDSHKFINGILDKICKKTNLKISSKISKIESTKDQIKENVQG